MTEEKDQKQEPSAASAPQKLPEALSVVKIRVVDAREPFPVLAQLGLGALPNIGDLLNIQTSTGVKGYRVEFRNFNPFDDFQVTLGCLPFNVSALSKNGAPTPKERMDELIKYNLQIFDKAQAYTNAIILAGYAGLFTLWNFTRTNLLPRQVDCVAIMLGVSLISFVTWQIYTMLQNASLHRRFNNITDETPEKFFERFDAFQIDVRRSNRNATRLWAWSFYPTVFLGYGAAALLLYNMLGHLLNLPQWP